MSGSDLDPSLLAAIQEAVAAGMAAQAPLPLAPPPGPALQMTTTPKLGLKLPALDDPALVTDLNDNAVILDDAITATVTATLYNKTLDAPVINNPTINGWTNAAHTHLNAASGGGLDGLAITSGYTGTGNLLRESATALLDPVVRDSIGWGAQPAGAVDTYLERVLAGRLRLTGSGADQAAMFEARATNVSTLSTTLARFGQAVPHGAWLTVNARYDEAGAAWKPDDVTKPARLAVANDISFLWYDAVGADPLVWRQRMALDGLGNLGVGMTPPALHPNRHALFVGGAAMLMSGDGYNATELRTNSYQNASNQAIAIAALPAGSLWLTNDSLGYANAPGVAAGTPQTFTTRMTIDANGTLTLSPDSFGAALMTNNNGYLGFNHGADPGIKTGVSYMLYGGGVGENWAGMGRDVNGQPWLRMGTAEAARGVWTWSTQGAVTMSLQNGAVVGGISIGSQTGNCRYMSIAANSAIELYGRHCEPFTDGYMNMGNPTRRWATMFALAGAINTSVWEAKEDFAPLDPAACAQAVLDTDWVRFTYRPAPPGEASTAAQHQRWVEESLVHRQQKGYVLGSPDHRTHDLFGLADRQSASPGSDLAVVACALQQALKDIADLKARLRERAPRPRREAA